jgi:hypothetical protein
LGDSSGRRVSRAGSWNGPQIPTAHAFTAKPFTLSIKLLMFQSFSVTFDLWLAPGQT